MQNPLTKNSSLLLIIAFCGAFLRVYYINFQSLWIDELTTMLLIDPSVSFKRMFLFIELKDKNPPLYYILVKFVVNLTDYKSSVARLTSASIGILSIFSMYFLGKELKSKEVGLTAATLAAFNYYLIYYSQEARCYILVFLFTTLSFLFFLRIINFNKRKDAILYCLSTIALIYTHYYGLLILLSQIVIFVTQFLKSGKINKSTLYLFVITIFITGCSFFPWILIILKNSMVKEFWIPNPSLLFPLLFFSDYFGNNIWLNALLLIPVISFANLINKKQFGSSIESNNGMSFVLILLVWIFLVYAIGFFISKFYIPLLIPRYTIVVLPAILLLIAAGIENIKSRKARYLLLGLICCVSLINLFFVKKHYSTVAKTQLEQASNFIIKSYNTYPIINDRTGLYQSYYLKTSHSKLTMIIPHLIDSVKQGIMMSHLKGFWLVGAHNESKPSFEIRSKSLKPFTKVLEKTYYDCWSQLYIANNYRCRSVFSFTPKDFYPKQFLNNTETEFLQLWDDKPFVSRIQVDSGKYSIVVSGYGTSVRGTYPKVIVSGNNSTILDFKLTGSENEIYKEVSFSKPLDCELKIKMMNDEVDVLKKEDRNAFIRYIIFRKLN